ncbi:hypothetical protein CFB34_015090 [Burkholderia sp. HI4860]|nr:hypothetical protein [Burkholderia sp. HI4860]MCI3970355.1 hypothetical protein [Burkholderia sp. HI4860]
MSSVAAFKVEPDFTAYNASKAAVASLTKSSRSTARAARSTCAATRFTRVHPHGIVEPLFQSLGERDATRKLARGIPLRRSASRTTSRTRPCISHPTRAAS